MSTRFAHLHLHSEYSLTDSTIRLASMVERCVALDQPAVAVTDSNNVFAAVKFHKVAEKAGIKPITGADILLANEGDQLSRLTLLCANYAGYLSLSRLLTRAYSEGHQGDLVLIRPEWLANDNQGLIALLGKDSRFGSQCIAEREDLAGAALGETRALFPDRLYIEMTRCGHVGEGRFNRMAAQLAFTSGLPVVASNNVRFLNRDDFEAHEARVCIATGRVLDDPNRPRDYRPEQYLKSNEEMLELFADAPDAISNSLDLARRCNLQMQLGTYHLPAFPVPSEHTLESWIRSESEDGLRRRLQQYPMFEGCTEQDYFDRLQLELGVINSMGFPGYFLIVADFINWAKRNDIPVGPGRGSGAGSLVAYALGITDLDPIRYDLLFERFLNPERVSMPDFDIDFCMDRRDEVIDYVAQKYGRDRVSQIITYGTMAAKAVLRDTGRVLGYPYGLVDGIAKLIPLVLGVTLNDALGRSEASKSDSNLRSSELIDRYDSDEDVRDLVDLALSLEDLTRNAGKHAGGVVIAPSPLSDFCPLYSEEGGRGAVTHFDKDDVEAVGLVKFDFLGLRTLTIIDWAVKAVNIKREAQGLQPIDITQIPLDDKPTYQLLSRGETTAVFQFESRGMKDYIRKLEPTVFEDLIALAALYRPGPLGSGMVDNFIDRRHGRAEIEYPHPLLEPILKPTYGVIVYQEQVMQIAQVMAGYSLGGADLLRRAMGKKKPEEMAKERIKFEFGAEKNSIDAAVASSIFDLMEKFAEYGFNKSHSAAYALVAYQTAWLKAHYPAEFMAATLSSDMDSTDKVVIFLEEARAFKLKVEVPDVNVSNYQFFASSDSSIRYGLGAIKGVGRGVCDAISDARNSGGNFADFLDFCQRVDPGKLNRRALEALIHAGALDTLAKNRASLMLQLPEVLKAAEQMQREKEAGQASLFGGPTATGIKIDLPETENWTLEQILAGERDTLGHYLSGHPLDPWRAEIRNLVGISLNQVEDVWRARKDRRGETSMVVAGMVGPMRRRGETMIFALLEDGLGTLEMAFFREASEKFGHLLSRDRILLVEGNVGEDQFNGGLVLRAKQAWDFKTLISDHGHRLSMSLDLRVDGLFERVQDLLAEYRPGGTSLSLQLITDAAQGKMELNGSASVRSAPDLLARLRRIPGVEHVELSLHRPWLQ